MKKTLIVVTEFLLALSLVVILHTFVFTPFNVSGESMVPNYQNGERVLAERISPLFSLRYNEVVIVRDPKDPSLFLIKRIEGLPGDRLKIENDQLYRNNHLIQEPYINAPMNQDMAEVVVPEGSIFVMGDNRNVSIDSRSTKVGPIPKKDIIAHVYFILKHA